MNSKTYRTTIRGFRDAALARKVEYRDKYDKKLEHLKFKYREDEQEKMDKIPDEIQEYVSLSIFDREKYDRLRSSHMRLPALEILISLMKKRLYHYKSQILCIGDTP